jgi:hypothetical protein
MATSLRLRLLSSVLFAAAWLTPLALPSFHGSTARAQDLPGQDVAGQEMPNPPGQDQPPGDEGDTPARGRRAKSKGAASKKGRRTTKGATGSGEKTAKSKKGAESPKESAESKTSEGEGSKSASTGIKFSRDIAPILVANCVGCHSQGRPGLTRGKLEMTSFAKLIQGTPKERVIDPGKPDDSHLILRVKGEEEPRMPPPRGNNRGLADETIAKIEQWVKEGAKLDAGLDPKAAMDSYAASPEQVRRNQIAKLSPKERDQKTEAAGRDRWKKANPKLKPEVAPGEHFLLFSTLPKDRATATVKAMETQYSHLKRMLGSPATDWVEKVSLYVFADRKDFVEFARSVENREVDASVSSGGNLSVDQPYVVAVDPLGGKKEEPAAPRRKARTKKGEEKETAGGSERTLLGHLSESLGEAAVAAQGKSPRWLSQGLGAFLAAQVEPRSPYYQKLRQTAREKYNQGWPTKATEALGEGNQVSAEEIRAVGFAIVECLMTPDYRQAFPAFARGMSAGKEKLDDVLKDVYGASREDFLNKTGDWVAERYGQDQ